MTPPEQPKKNEPAPPVTDSNQPESASTLSTGHSRRVFLFKLSLLINGAIGAVLAVPIIGYLLGPAARKTANASSWITLGPLTDFPEGQTRLVNFRNPVTTSWDGQTGDIPCWARRVSGTTFQVFAINCAHLGCPVRWFAQSKLFLCPCHGGAYYADGARASGPPERGLFEYDHKIAANTLMIKVGKLPTLASPMNSSPTSACAKPPLTQIENLKPTTAANVASIEKPNPKANPKPNPRCASCQG